MQYKIIIVLLFGLLSFTSNKSNLSSDIVPSVSNTKAENIYHSLNAKNFVLPNIYTFTKAVEGFYKLKEKGVVQKDFLTLVDFSLSSNVKRFWVIDMKTNTILFHSLVAHGRNTGNEFAQYFSNKPESNQSSLGFYATAETYFGKHGYSLRLDGLEPGINSNARERAIVIHGADYVSENFIQQHGRLGRSFGCPSLPNEISKEIIETIKDKSCLYVYYSSNTDKI
ncbi:MAG: murein L,D-transpeptidase catalytic domain family protein [Flavobacteriaceae bacterium]|nr:murein L,D-transpeptidase catalytic domain family protein [Flavobacteriaceae bacterium]